jgi:hypothetical protein
MPAAYEPPRLDEAIGQARVAVRAGVGQDEPAAVLEDAHRDLVGAVAGGHHLAGRAAAQGLGHRRPVIERRLRVLAQEVRGEGAQAGPGGGAGAGHDQPRLVAPPDSPAQPHCARWRRR